jgi:hypothetical protein
LEHPQNCWLVEGQGTRLGRDERTDDSAEPSTVMKPSVTVLLLTIVLLGCTSTHGRTTQMNPDCTQVSAEEQAKGNCMYRPEVPDGL